jgi:hypothetical protein
MTVKNDALYALLPAVHRQRDAELGEPLRQLLDVLTDELAVLAHGVDQLYDDLFVETAAPWVLPYLAELIGLRGLPSGTSGGLTPRAEVANTIRYRRRKGTAAVLEQVAHDVTGWPARAVEFFELIASTQHVNHIRPDNLGYAPIRNAGRLEYVGTPFERLAGQRDLTHTVEVRRIHRGRGRYNIPNIGVFSWRLGAYPLTKTSTVPAESGERHRFRLHPLGIASPLFNLPVTEQEITHLTEPVNVPHSIGRREFSASVGAFYGPGLSIDLPGVNVEAVDICDLSDVVDAGVVRWAHTPRPKGRVAIDPVLGRVAYGDDQGVTPLASYHYGFSADLGGGEYQRAHTFAGFAESTVRVSQQDPNSIATIAGGVAALAGSGTVEIADSGRYGPVPNLTVDSRAVEIRAINRRRPVVVLDNELVIDGNSEGELTLNGLLITGGPIRTQKLRTLRLRHCTLVPGSEPSVIVESAATTLIVERCILGPLRVNVDAEASLTDSICDAGQQGIAYASEEQDEPTGGRLTLEACTVLGRVHAHVLELISNSILLATGDTPVLADRRQEGCIRFSFLPPGSRTPRRHRCQPADEADAARVRPVLRSEHYPDPSYGQLDRGTAEEILRGADDESEMGALHHLLTPQRLAYLEARLDDYLRFGLEAGFLFAS